MGVNNEELQILAESVGSLRESLKAETNRRKAAEKDLSKARTFDSLGRLFVALGICAGTLILSSIGGWALYRTIATPDTVTHCVIEESRDRDCPFGYYRLNGVVPWGFDKRFGSFRTVDSALAQAEKIGCRVRQIRPQ